MFQFRYTKKIKTHEFVVFTDSGEIVDTIHANSKSIDHLPDLSTRIVLRHVNGVLDNNAYFSSDANICRKDCFIDPNTPLDVKLKEGTEDEFDFFMKNGYHKSTLA
tara:strand:+ start:89 stop:406 length:318 start_codon:yes stop_codon:yes gene_type:complete